MAGSGLRVIVLHVIGVIGRIAEARLRLHLQVDHRQRDAGHARADRADLVQRGARGAGEVADVVEIGVGDAVGAAFAAQGLTPEGLDPLWSNLLPLILRVGTIMLRHHIERHTDGPLYDPEQLSRWNAAVTRMICHGQMK